MPNNKGIITIQEWYNSLKEHGRLLDHRFGLTITKSGLEDIALFGQSATIPSRTINTASLKYFGQEIDLPTTLDEGRRWSVELYTDKNNDYYNRMRSWQEEFASWERSGGGYKGISTVNGYIDLYNNDMSDIVDSFTIKGLTPLEVGELSLSHEGSDFLSFTCQFSFILSFNSRRGVDPLR